MTHWIKVLASLAVLAILVVAPLVVDLGSNVMNVMVTFFIYVILAQSWNLLGGYTGQVNLGIVAFFGISTITTDFLSISPYLRAVFLPLSLLQSLACQP
jgi:branched-chain amino acid transport system permease protein